MIKDLSQSLVAAVAEINKSSRQKYVTELNALNEKVAGKAMKMPKQPEPKADPAAHSDAASMAKKNMKAEAAEGSHPRNEKEKKLAAMTPPANKITHGDVLKGRGVMRKEGWDDMLKAAKERRAAEGTGKFDKRTTGTGTVYTRKSSTFDDGGKDADMKKADKKMKQEEAVVDEAMHIMPYNSRKTTPAGERYKNVISHAKKMGYNVHHQESRGDERSGNKGSPDITIHYQRGDDRHNADPEAIEIHKGAAQKDKVLHALAKGKASSVKENKDTPGNSTHQCAIHVKSEQFGEGRTLTSQHAEPDADGHIAWYDVMFAEGIKRVNTEDIEVLVSESHMNHKKKKGM